MAVPLLEAAQDMVDKAPGWGDRVSWLSWVALAYAGVGVTLCGLMAAHILKCRVEQARCVESHQLRFDRLTKAECSSAKDRERILQALAGQEVAVEQALRTLMQHGMSTAELRRASVLHTLSGKGYADMGSTVFALLFWPLYCG